MELILSFESSQELRAWLEAHHDQGDGIWLELYKDGRPGITLREAQEEGFCFGWVDSLLRSVDASRYRLKFTKRRRKSKWSARNRKIAGQLIESGRMAPAGLAAIEEAKANGTWEAVDERPLLEDTEGFLGVLRAHGDAGPRYAALTDSLKRHYAGYYFAAKQDVTRERRLKAILAAMKTKKRILG